MKLTIFAIFVAATFNMTDYFCVQNCTAQGYQYGLCVKYCTY